MAVVINGSGTVDGISVGGFNNGIITQDEFSPSWAPAGTFVNIAHAKLSATYTATFSGNGFATIPALSATITPKNANSRFLVILNLYIGTNNDGSAGYQNECQILRNGSVVTAFNGDGEGGRQGVAAMINQYAGSSGNGIYTVTGLSGVWLDSPATTSPITYGVQARNYSGGTTIYINRSQAFQSGGLDYDGIPQSTITVIEIAG